MKVSLVIPVKNEADSIERLIASVAAQTRRPDEVVIVDGGSCDGTPDIVERWVEKHSLSDWIRTLRVEDATPGKGRNIGVENASHEWIAFTDAGIRVEHFWIERLAEVAERQDDVEVVYGAYEPIIESFFDRCSALTYVHPKQLRVGEWMRGPVIPSSLIRREVWKRIGGFQDLRAAEDLIFLEAIEQEGFRIGWAPRAVVWWRMPPDLISTFRRFALYSMHNARIGRQYDWHYGVARKYIYFLMLSIPALAGSGWLWLLPASLYLARTAKYVWIRREGRGLAWTLNPLQYLGVMIILQTIDIATFVGWWRAISEKWQPVWGHIYNIGSFLYRWRPTLHWLRVRRNRTL